MKPSRTLMHLSAAIAASLVLLGSGVQAQPGPGPGPGPAASAPGPGMGMGMMGAGPKASGNTGRMHGRAGRDYTPGWSMMTEAERAEHQQRMRQAKSHEECTAMRNQHREQMAARAKEKGMTKPLPMPRRDACAALKPKP